MNDQGRPSTQSPPVRVKRPGDRRSLSRSATRALDVLEHLGQMRRPLRAVEIARALDLRPSTANQLLKTMLDSAHLIFDAGTKTYLPSPRLAPFSAWMVDTYGADERLRALVRDLQAKTGEIVTLTTANDLFMQVLDFAAPTPATGEAERGLSVSMFGSAIGAAYLSMLPDAEIERMADRARLSAADLRETLLRIAQIRRDGVSDGPSVEGRVWSIAAPLPRGEFPTLLVLGLAGPTERVQARATTLRELLQASAARCRPVRSVSMGSA